LAVKIYSSVTELVESDKIWSNFPKTNNSANINSANKDSGNNRFRINAKKKNEKYLNGAEIFLIPPKLRKIDKNNFIPISRSRIATSIVGKITAVVLKKTASKLYSLHKEKKDSINKDGLGNKLCSTRVNSNKTI